MFIYNICHITPDGALYWLSEPAFILVLLIWIVFITLLFLVGCLYLVHRRPNKNKHLKWTYIYKVYSSVDTTQGAGDATAGLSTSGLQSSLLPVAQRDEFFDYLNKSRCLPLAARTALVAPSAHTRKKSFIRTERGFFVVFTCKNPRFTLYFTGHILVPRCIFRCNKK